MFRVAGMCLGSKMPDLLTSRGHTHISQMHAQQNIDNIISSPTNKVQIHIQYVYIYIIFI